MSRGLVVLLLVGCGSSSATIDAANNEAPDAAASLSPDAAAPEPPDAAALPDARPPDAAAPPDATPPDAAPPITDLYVDCAKGHDNAAGTSSGAPLKSVTHALGMAGAGTTVHLAPCVYDATNGEVFPLAVPPGATLLGDEANKGEAVKPTRIVGEVTTFQSATLEPGAGSVIAGLSLRNTGNDGGSHIVVIRHDSATVRNNTIQDSPGIGIYVNSAAKDLVISGNRVTGSKSAGLAFVASSGAGTKIENNELRMNKYGVEYDSPGADLGGGAAGSTGGNILACNAASDLWTAAPITIYARFNKWDHAPPTTDMVSENGQDIRLGPATVVTTGATVAPSPCP